MPSETKSEFKFTLHSEYESALSELAALREQLERLPQMEREAQEEARRLSESAFAQAVEDARGADRALLGASAARSRAELIAERRKELERRIRELEDLTGPGGRLHRENAAHVTAQAEKYRTDLLRRFVEQVEPIVENLLAEASAIEQAVHRAGGYVDIIWQRPLDEAARAVRAAQERIRR
jgi:small-conductance mechanosensitive channel